MVSKCWDCRACTSIDFYMFFLSYTTVMIYFCILVNYSGRADNAGRASERSCT